MANKVEEVPVKSSSGSAQIKFKSEVLSSFYNPFSEFLGYVKKLNNYNSSNPKSSPVQAWELFSQWIVESKPDLSLRTCETKKEAFLLASKYRCPIVREICYYAYDLGSNKELLKDNEKLFTDSMLYAEMAQWVSLFHMHEDFPDETFIVPLILMSASKCLFMYLKKAREDDKIRVAKLMDNWLQSPNLKLKINEISRQVFGDKKMPDGKPIKLISEFYMRSMLQNIARQFRIPLSELPGLDMRLRHCFMKKLVFDWQSKQLSHDALREQLADLAGSNRQLQEMILEFLESTDDQEASYWASHFNIPLKGEVVKKKPLNVVAFNDDEFYTIDNLDEMINYIDSPEKCQSLLTYLTELDQTDTVVGIDSEWKPSYSYEESPPSLLQLAFEDKIFVIDVKVLLKEKEFWGLVNKHLLQNPKILKIGYSLSNDKSVLRNAAGLSFLTMSGVKFLDLEKSIRFLKPFVSTKRVEFPHTISRDDKRQKNLRGLQLLVWQCVGKPLDKRETLSDWARRPLRGAQIHYAALDAYILLKIYKSVDEMMNKVSKSDHLAAVDEAAKLEPERKNKFFRNKKSFKNNKLNKKNTPSTEKRDDEKSGSVKESTSGNKRAPRKQYSRRSLENGATAGSSQVNENTKAKVMKIDRPLTPFSICSECVQEHNTRKCPQRTDVHRQILNLFKTLQNLSKACNIDDLCKELAVTIKSIYPDKNIHLPELGWIAINSKKMVHSAYFFVAKTFVRSPTVGEFLIFFEDLYSLLEKCCSLLIGCAIDRQQAKQKITCWDDMCTFCFKTGHKSVNCFTKKNFVTAQEKFLSLIEKLKEVEKEWLTFPVFLKSAEDRFEKAMAIPDYKKVMKRFPKCSFCHRFGHFDVTCRRLNEDVESFNNVLQNCDYSTQKCLNALGKML